MWPHPKIGDRWMTTKSANFWTRAPEAWQQRANTYLLQMEHLRVLWQKVTSKKGPVSTEVRWRLNTNGARARLGGKNSWMSLPFRGITIANTPFDRPKHSVHEMGHTFGYNHGKEMTARVNDVRREIYFTPWLEPIELYDSSDVTFGEKTDWSDELQDFREFTSGKFSVFAL